MKLYHLVIYLFAGTFMIRLVLVIGDKEEPEWGVAGIIILVCIAFMGVGFYDKRKQNGRGNNNT